MAMNPRLLRPRASAGYGLDARDWQSRVIANGGTVSASTMKAVDTFCKAIVTAGIRDRFYRFGIFAGSNLNAALVPLYRGPSLGGTQFGNATDTNTNFVSGDYVETGATAGLTGNGSTKFLNTGLAPNAATEIGATGHLAVHGVVNPSTSGNAVIGTDNGASQVWWLRQVSTTLLRLNGSYGGGVDSGSVNDAWFAGTFIVTTRRSSTDLETYVNGASRSTVATSASPSVLSTPMYVFASNRSNSAIIHAANTIGAYSIGAAMTDEQVTSYYNAMKTLQATLGRNAA